MIIELLKQSMSYYQTHVTQLLFSAGYFPMIDSLNITVEHNGVFLSKFFTIPKSRDKQVSETKQHC